MSTIDAQGQLCDRRVYDAQVIGDEGLPIVVSYVLRGLNNDAEVATWTLFCEEAFAYKKPSPPTKDYFARHYFSDPCKHPSHVRIAVAKRDSDSPTQLVCFHDIVASCRIFHRTISLAGFTNDSADPTVKTATAGGIGEVCTHELHRCRGLAKELLNDALACMAAMQMNVSSLHSAPSFFPVYQKSGYVNATSRWSVITINHSNLLTLQQNSIRQSSSSDTFGSPSRIRLASFPSDTLQLKKLHRYYSEQRFLGCIVRSTEYWNCYISAELGDKLWILEEVSVTRQDTDVENSNPSKIQGWMALRFREQQKRYQLCEFGCFDIQEAPCIFQKLLIHCHETVEMSRPPSDHLLDDTKTGIWMLHLPTPVLNDVRGNVLDHCSCFISDTLSESDDGWMYKSLTGNSLDMASLARRHEHVIWPSDSF